MSGQHSKVSLLVVILGTKRRCIHCARMMKPGEEALRVSQSRITRARYYCDEARRIEAWREPETRLAEIAGVSIQFPKQE